MNLQGNKKLCIAILVASRKLLNECLNSSSLIPNVNDIASALINIENVVVANPEINFYYKDILCEEAGYFRRKEVPFLSMFNGKLLVLPFDELDENSVNRVGYIDNGEQGTLPSSDHYILGNEAIGQVFIDGRRAFCSKFAIEHSLRSIVNRWCDGCDKLIKRFEEMLI